MICKPIITTNGEKSMPFVTTNGIFSLTNPKTGSVMLRIISMIGLRVYGEKILTSETMIMIQIYSVISPLIRFDKNIMI